MTLATRLNRLRSGTGLSPARQSASIGRSGHQACPIPVGLERLAAALNGQCLADNLVVSEYLQTTSTAPVGLPDVNALPETCGLTEANWLYIDTETTGLSGGAGNIAFMIGLARYDRQNGLQVRQFTLGNFAAERAMLSALDAWLDEATVLVSYNGRGFDVPLLSARHRLHQLNDKWADLPHLDLMYTVRRSYRDTWPDCRLQTAEQRRLGLWRVDDLPGSEAPSAWQAWLRNGEIEKLQRVLTHNRQDVVSLASLHAAMCLDHSEPAACANVFKIGLAWRSAGQSERCMRLWERHRARLDATGLLALAASYRRAGRWQEAEQLWLSLHGNGNREAASALSKYHEHRRRDYRRALEFAQCCSRPEKEKRVCRLLRKLRTRQQGRNLELPLTGAAPAVFQSACLPNVSMK